MDDTVADRLNIFKNAEKEYKKQQEVKQFFFLSKKIWGGGEVINSH